MGLLDLLSIKLRKYREILCPYCFGKLDIEHLQPACSRHPQAKIDVDGQYSKILINDGYGGIKGTSCPLCYNEHDLHFLAIPADSVYCNAKESIGKTKCSGIIPLAAIDPSYTVFSIALVGAPGSGVTCYKLRLIEELRAEFKQPDCIRPYSYFPILDKDKPLPSSTPCITDYARPEFYSFVDTNGDKILLIIYDFAGKDVAHVLPKIDLKDNTYVVLTNTFSHADAIFFLIDPEQSFKDHLGNKEYANDTTIEMHNVIKGTIKHLEEMINNQSQKKVAYIFTKADRPNIANAYKEFNYEYPHSMVLDSDGNPIYSASLNGQVFNPQDLLVEFVKKHDPDYKRIFGRLPFCNEEDVRYFIVSSLGFGFEQKQGENTISKLGRPFRVLEPLL